jgi:hypothetical protein
MGQFGAALAEGLTSGLASGLSGSISSLIGNIGYGRRLKKQVEAQKKLNEQAAQLNYEYGEKAAENAYNRQMAMYERSYEDQSYKAMRKQMEDAGLSVGLMYGGGGTGGAGGATTGAPQGETGGAQAGTADSPAAQQAAAAQQAQTGLALMMMKKDLKLKDAQIDEINATAEAKRAEAGLTTEQKVTEMQAREAKIRDVFEVGKSRWIENLQALYEDSTQSGENDILEAEDEFFGKHSIIGKRMRNQEFANEIMLKQAKAMEALGNEKAAKALAELNSEKKKYLYKEVMIAAQNADAHSMEAAAKKLAAEWETGEYANWKTWTTLGAEAVKMILSTIGIGKLGAINKALKGAVKKNGGTMPKQFADYEIPMVVD